MSRLACNSRDHKIAECADDLLALCSSSAQTAAVVTASSAVCPSLGSFSPHSHRDRQTLYLRSRQDAVEALSLTVLFLSDASNIFSIPFSESLR